MPQHVTYIFFEQIRIYLFTCNRYTLSFNTLTFALSFEFISKLTIHLHRFYLQPRGNLKLPIILRLQSPARAIRKQFSPKTHPLTKYRLPPKAITRHSCAFGILYLYSLRASTRSLFIHMYTHDDACRSYTDIACGSSVIFL